MNSSTVNPLPEVEDLRHRIYNSSKVVRKVLALKRAQESSKPIKFRLVWAPSWTFFWGEKIPKLSVFRFAARWRTWHFFTSWDQIVVWTGLEIALQPLSPILVKTILKMVRLNLLEMHSSDYGQLLAIYRQDLFSKWGFLSPSVRSIPTAFNLMWIEITTPGW